MADDFKELIDVLDENGQLVGKQETKEELYQDGHWHRSVHIWIMNDKQELLVQKRNPYKKTFSNLWAISTAGHVLAGENSLQAGIRELKEELNLDVQEKELEYLFTIKRSQQEREYQINVFDDVYLLHRNLDVDHTKLQVEELTDIKFVYYEYLESIFKNGDHDYVPYTEEHQKLFDLLDHRYQLEII